MKPTSRETYKVVRAMLEMKKFTQYQVSKQEDVTFSLVNRVVNWFVARGYVAKRKGYYEVAAAGATFAIFPLFRRMTPYAVFDVNLPAKDALEMLKGKATLCLTSALSYYDDYYRDAAIYAYSDDEGLAEELKGLPKGYTHIEFYKDDLQRDTPKTFKGQKVTGKARTIIDLFCSNKAYVAERLVRKEWG